MSNSLELVEPYVYDTVCHFAWWKIFDGKLPDWDCTDIMLNYIPAVRETIVMVEKEITVELQIGIFFVLVAGLLGSLIVELFYNKIDLFFEPVEKKYARVLIRKRLESMRGHP